MVGELWEFGLLRECKKAGGHWEFGQGSQIEEFFESKLAEIEEFLGSKLTGKEFLESKLAGK